MEITAELVADAFALAAKCHRKQVDKSGAPYIRHVVTVASAVHHLGFEYEIVGVLHDIVEDTPCTLDEIESLFGPTIRDGVDAMTRRAGEVYFVDYLPRVKGNPLSLAVKKADSAHNLSRNDTLDNEDQRKSLKKKYERVLRELDA